MPHPAEPAIRSRIAGNARRFDALVMAAERAMAEGRLPEAVAKAQQAGVLAWQFHPGFFASPRLERLLAALSERALPPWPARPAAASPMRVLHVLTQAARVGGHTKLAWRWIRQDAGRTHAIALIDQGPVEVPAWLNEAATASGGAVHRIDQAARSPLERAAELRRLAGEADLVVLHAHPHDVVPLLAMTGAGRPPTVLMNHADHVFWLGVSVADVVANIRQRATDLCVDRRGIDSGRCALLPIPLDPVARTVDRAEARRRLGLPEDAVLLLTVATAYKYNPLLDGPDLVASVLPVLQAHPQAMLVAVGPPDRGAWRRAGRATGGRVRALGERADLPLFYQAADIYLESTPIGSLTALLEAGSYGLPLLSHQWLPGAASQMATDNPGTAGAHLQATSVAAYRESLTRLIEAPSEREVLGERIAAGIQAHHGPDAWKLALESIYQQAMVAPPASAPPGEAPGGLTEHDVYLEYLHRRQKIQMVLDMLRRPSFEQVKLMLNRLRMYR